MSEEATLDEFAQTEHSNERKETPIGELPADWDVEWLNSVVAINSDGFSEDDWPSDTFEYISLSEASNGDILGSKTTQIDEAPSRAQRTVQQGDVLVGTVRPKQKSHGLVTEEHDGKICSSGFGVLRTGPNLNSRYLIQEVLSNRFFSQMEAYVAGSGYPAVKLSDLKKHRVSIPPLSEQRKIATVLYTVDQAIENTERIIEQAKTVEKGLMQDLFRNGIGKPETKELRRIGQVPEHWDVVKLGSVCEKITDGTHKSPPTIKEGYPYVTSQNIRNWGFDLSDLKYISEEDHNRITSRCDPEEGDVLYVKDGANTGNVNVNTLDFEFSLLSSVALIKPDRNRVKPWFLKYLLSWPKFRELVLSQMSGTGIRRLTISKLEKTDVLVPPIKEQEQIVDLLDEYYICQKNQKEIKSQFERLKQGLMQDLLSGTVRTTNTNITVPDEVAQHG